MSRTKFVLLTAAVVAIAIQAPGPARNSQLKLPMATAQSASPAAAESPIPRGGLIGEQHLRKLNREEMLREHSDKSGNVRTDLWRKNVEHAHGMQVAPYIGASPSKPAASVEASPAAKK